MSYDTLFLSGAVTAAPVHIGHIQYLEEANIMPHIRTFIGVSSGAIVSLMAYLGMTSKQQAVAYREFSEKFRMEFNCIDSFISDKGMDNGSCIFNVVHFILKMFNLPETSTFSMISSPDKKFVVCVSNLTTSSSENLSLDTTPDMPVAMAIRMSCSMPLIFTPVEYQGSFYIDGAIFNKCPMCKGVKGAIACNINLGVLDVETTNGDAMDVFGFLMMMSTSIIKHYLVNLAVQCSVMDGVRHCVNIKLNSRMFNTVDLFRQNIDGISDYIQLGYTETRRQLDSTTTHPVADI